MAGLITKISLFLKKKEQSLNYFARIIYKIIECDCHFLVEGTSCDLNYDVFSLYGLGFRSKAISEIIQNFKSSEDGIFDLTGRKFSLNGLSNIDIAKQIRVNKQAIDSKQFRKSLHIRRTKFNKWLMEGC